MTYIVGITGGIGSGKSTVAHCFGQYGIEVIDTDAIAHKLTQTNGAALPAIATEFGSAFLTPEGSLNRKKMRQHIFANAVAKEKLEAILHPMIGAASEQFCRNSASPYLLLVVPLLIESSGWKERCQRILVVDCRVETQIARVMARNQLSEEEVRTIILSQISRENRLAYADDVIDNDGSVNLLSPQIKKLHEFYLSQAKNFIDHD